MTRRFVIPFALLAAACGSETGTTSDPSPLPSLAQGQAIGSAEVGRALATARAATAKYQDVEQALADGYAPTSPCVSVPGLGGMGVHYLKPALAGDVQVDPTQPELLLYEPQANGRLRLVAVEFFVVKAVWDGAGMTGAPTLAGVPFEGPMIHDGLPEHWDLHAWVWRENPNGMFTSFNPKVRCGAA